MQTAENINLYEYIQQSLDKHQTNKKYLRWKAVKDSIYIYTA